MVKEIMAYPTDAVLLRSQQKGLQRIAADMGKGLLC